MPKVSRHHLAEVIAERTVHVSDTKELAREIAAYLLIERRKADLESLLRDIMQYRANRGIVEARVVSAHDLTSQVKDDVEAILKDEYPDAKTLLLRSKLDESVIGGIRLELANEQLDMTVRSKLDTFKRLTSGVKD
jgi:F0F1-type ATP synthase delta subunit